mgnify:CR=1 FL=1
MKRKKLFLNLILAALGTVSFLGACEKKDDTSESIVEPAVYEDGEYTLLDFENQSDLYKTRIYTEQILDIYGKVEIYSDSETAEEKHVISGNSSLKYSVTDKVAEEAHYKPGLLFFFGESAYPDLPVERFASTSLMLSSSAEKNIQVTMSVVSTKKSLFSEEFTVKKGRNNELKLAIDSTMTMFRAEDIYAVCIEFPECTGYDFYIDDWKVTLAKTEETEEQKAAKAFVNKVNEIENSGAPTAESLLDAYNNYNKLGKACRAAVEAYYSKFTSQISSFIEIKSWEGTSQKIDILSLSENYGVLQLDEVGGVKYVYNEKILDDTNGTKFIFEKGGIYKIPFEIATIVIGNYDYLTFTIKNNFNAPITISFNDSNNKFTIDADSTKTAEMLVGDLNETENHITIQIDSASREISSENAIEMVLSSVTANALPKNDIKYTLGENCYNVSGGAKLSKNGEKFSVAVTDTSARLAPIKEIATINVAQNVSFEMSANTNAEATFYDADGNKITSAFLTTDLTLVTLSKEEYEELAYITFSGSANVTISNMLLTRVADKDYAETLFYNDYIVKADKITSYNIREAFYYVSLFESMYGYKQNKLKEQSERVYNDIIARAGKVSEIFMNSISKLEKNTATETDYLIIGDMYDRYLNLKSVTPLSGAQKKFVNANKGKFLKYKHTVFEFDDLSTVYNFGFNSQFWDNNVNFSVENVFDSKKLVANITRIATDESITGNTYRVYITYRGTVSSDYDYIVWNIYNPTDHGMSMYFVNYGWNSTVCGPYSLSSGKWTEVKISARDFANAGQFVILGCNIGDKLYFDDVYCYSHVIAQEKINELPDADHLTDADVAKVFEARKEYDKLSSAGKRKVNATKLFACEEKLNKLSERTIINMSDSNVLNRFSVDDYFSDYKWIGNIYQTTDSAKGGILAINIEKRTGKQNVIYAKYDISGVEISSYKTVKFSIYNPLSVAVSFALISDGNWTTKSDLVTLQSGKWTEVEISVETFLKCAHFYFGSEDADFDGQTFLITDIIASKE